MQYISTEQEYTPVHASTAIFNHMDERFLHYVWRFQQFDSGNLCSTQNESISVFHPGFLNHHSGPDFSEARLKIGSMEWAGQVEIHLRSSDWLRHGHQRDAAYGNVILHVVYEHDKNISNADGSTIPTIELKKRIHPDQFRKYFYLRHQRSQVSCESQLASIPEITVASMIDRVVMERMEQKTRLVTEGLKSNHNDWERATLRLLCKALGMKTNSDPFDAFARSLPLNKLSQHNAFQKESLIFGLAGFLEHEPIDDYQTELQKEFHHLCKKLKLIPRLSRHHWKYARLRPANFPTVRLAQLSMILKKETRLFSRLIEANDLNEIRELFQTPAHDYWSKYYDFGKKSKRELIQIGQTTLESVIINAIVPLLVSYGQATDDQRLVEKAISWLEKIKPENNVITRQWKELGLDNQNALQSQGLLQLYKEYCSRKRCLQCSIGNKILTQK